MTHYKNDFTNLDHTSPLGKSGHSALAIDYHVANDNERLSHQARPDIWKENIQCIVYSVSSVGWPIEPKSPTETGLGVIVTKDSKTIAPYLLITSKGFETL